MPFQPNLILDSLGGPLGLEVFIDHGEGPFTISDEELYNQWEAEHFPHNLNFFGRMDSLRGTITIESVPEPAHFLPLLVALGCVVAVKMRKTPL